MEDSLFLGSRERLTKLTDWIDGEDGLQYAYDNAGRLTEITDYDGAYLTYAYDAAGNVTSMTDYHEHTTTYTYTDTGQLSTITAPGSKTWSYTYNAIGQPTSVGIPNGMTTAYSYDNRNRLTKIGHKDGDTVLDGFTYALDQVGNITRTTYQDSAYWDYFYDGRYRLTKAERNNSSSELLHRYTYSYDAGDNMSAKSVYDAGPQTTTTTNFTYNNANELTSSATGGATTSYAYDAWGQQTSKTQGDYSCTYAYRYGDKLYSVTSNFPNEGNVTYQYGADQKRRERTTGGTTTKYRWEAGFVVINEEDSYGTLTRTYIGRTMAHVDGTNPANGDYRYYFHDNLGSSRSVRNEDKSSYAAFEHEPYGDIYASSGTTSAVNHRFTGHDWDGTSGLYYAPFRYYSPTLARWLTRDPLGMVDGPNLYMYGVAAPTDWIDPFGLSIWDWYEDATACFYTQVSQLPGGTQYVQMLGGQPGYIDCLGRCIEVNGCDPGTIPSGWSFPAWPVVHHNILKWVGLGKKAGQSRWSTPIMTGTTWLHKYFKIKPPSSLSRWIRRVSKGAPYLTILDGTLSAGKIAKCAIYCAYGMKF